MSDEERSESDLELDALGEFLSWQYGRPHTEHWEDLTDSQKKWWRQDACAVRDWLDQYRKVRAAR